MWNSYVKQVSHGLIWGALMGGKVCRVLMGKESSADRILYVDRLFYAEW